VSQWNSIFKFTNFLQNCKALLNLVLFRPIFERFKAMQALGLFFWNQRLLLPMSGSSVNQIHYQIPVIPKNTIYWRRLIFAVWLNSRSPIISFSFLHLIFPPSRSCFGLRDQLIIQLCLNYHLLTKLWTCYILNKEIIHREAVVRSCILDKSVSFSFDK